MIEMREIVVAEDRAGMRLDGFLHGLYPGVSVNRWRRALAEGLVRVDGRRAVKGLVLGAGQKVVFPAGLPAELAPQEPLPEAGELEVVFRDGDLLAVSKPAGCHTHPLAPGETGTLVNRLLYHFPELAGVGGFGPLQPGLLNRLDWATSGIVLAACNDAAWERVRAEFAGHQVRKEYLGLAAGRLDSDLTVAVALTHDPGDARKMAVVDKAAGGRGRYPARTEIRALAFRPDFNATLVELVMYTGVMHQLRVHLAHAGFPLVGDTLYGGPPRAEESGPGAGREPFLLHCRTLVLPSGPKITAPVPAWAEL
jgi:23S rRNA pseudouridine1911/1915/1917 synthase